MRRSRFWKLLVLLVGLLAGCTRPEPILILVSLDGFRWDYLDRVETPHLNRLAAAGVKAERLIPVFPSKTFPSHYSIVTGLYPGHHGIISNNMIDPEIEGEFHLSNRRAVGDGRWWGGEPIWVTAEKQGLISACLFWPGCEAEIAGFRPTHWEPYDGDKSFETRVEQVLGWLDLPESERPRLIALYFQDPNDISHHHGPESPETFAAVREVDARVGDLAAGIEQRGLWDRVHLIVVSDHGMAAVDAERMVYLDDFIELEDGELFEDGALVQIYPREGREDLVYEALHGASPYLTVYRRDEIPESFHLRVSPRAPRILGVPEVGWEVTGSRGSARDLEIRTLKGDHGQDPADSRMHGLFVARGRKFHSEVVIKRLDGVDIYTLMTMILELEPMPNDGNPENLKPILQIDE